MKKSLVVKAFRTQPGEMWTMKDGGFRVVESKVRQFLAKESSVPLILSRRNNNSWVPSVFRHTLEAGYVVLYAKMVGNGGSRVSGRLDCRETVIRFICALLEFATSFPTV